MTVPHLIVNGNEIALRALDLTARLDHGSQAKAFVWQHVAGLRAGLAVKVRAGANALDMIVQRFHVQRGSGGGELCLVDPLVAARPFLGDAFSSADETTGLDRAVAARVPVGGRGNLAGEKFPAIIMHRVSLVEALTEICARHRGWHFRWHDGKAEIGPLPDGAAVALDGAGGADTDQGLAARVHGALPPLGNLLKVLGEEGRLLAYTIRYHETGDPVQDAIIGQPAVLPRSDWDNAWVPCVVEKKAPLFVRVALPDGREAATRAKLHSWRSDQGRCRFAFPLAVGDPLLLAWPRGVFTGEPVAVPLAEVPASARLEMFAESAGTSWNRWDATAQKIDFKVSDEVHFHT
jgi:hypothetical protein